MVFLDEPRNFVCVRSAVSTNKQGLPSLLREFSQVIDDLLFERLILEDEPRHDDIDVRIVRESFDSVPVIIGACPPRLRPLGCHFQ